MLSILPPDQIAPPAAVPRLLVELPSWPRVFFTNLRDLVLPRRTAWLELHSAPAPFWPDVFVKRGLPWLRFVESALCHVLAFAMFTVASRFFALQPQAVPALAFDRHEQVVVYEAAEYLPPLDTLKQARSEEARHKTPAPADPEMLARQEVISLPPEADNRSQTIVTPPTVTLKRDIALPNIVRWSDKAEMPQLAIPPAPLTPAAEITRMAPHMENSVVAPPPDLRVSRAAIAFAAPQPAVIAPAPGVESASPRRLGQLEIARSSVIAPAPQLQVEAQRAVPGGRPGVAQQVVAPPPSLSGAGSPGRIVALNLHPAVGAPPDPPQGNRRGAFAATPPGRPGASGSPGRENGIGSNQKGSRDLPAGLYVGSAPASAKTSPVAGDPAGTKSANTVNPNLTASIRAPRVSAVPTRPMPPDSAKLSEPERAVFGNRRFYSLTLSMPNLNSAGGSWMVRFAELDHGSKSSSSAALSDASADPSGDISQPAATRKVDPGYPLQLMRENVAGTVILYAVIRADGSVGNVRVLRGVDDRLDGLAKEAVARWQFQPATKNGSPVAVEATFHIPFHPPSVGTNF